MALDGLINCIACGKKIERIGTHKCDPKFEKRREAIDRRERKHIPHVFSEAERLSYGFYLMSIEGTF